MRMFLASTFACVPELFMNKYECNHNPRVLFVANPSDPFKYKYWVKKDRNAFLKNGFSVSDCDLRKEVLGVSDILDFDVLHVCGGSALYFQKLLNETGYDQKFIAAISRGITYTGTSAGSMVMCRDLSFCADDEDEKEAGMIGKLKDMRGLGLIPFYLLCHSQEKYYIPSTVRAMKRLPKYKFPVLTLRDNMALWVEDGKFQVVQK